MRPLRVVLADFDPGTDVVRVRLMGPRVCAGFPSPADDFIEEEVALPRWLAPNPPATFVWRIAGWSVVGAGIHDGDLAVVDRSLSPVADDIVVAVIDGEHSLKRYRIEGNRAVLAFENPDLPAFALEDGAEATIWGVVRVSLRLHRPLVRA